MTYSLTKPGISSKMSFNNDLFISTQQKLDHISVNVTIEFIKVCAKKMFVWFLMNLF